MDIHHMDYKLDKVWLLDSHIHNLLPELMLLPQVNQADPQLMEQHRNPHHIHLHGDGAPHGGVLRDDVLHG